MTPATANLINSICLILMGIWGYFEVSSITALIPVGFGVVLLICYFISNAKPNLNKVIAHVAVLFTLIILGALLGVRLPKSIDAGGVGLFRVVAMISTSILSMVFFVKNFIDSRKNK
ncbi:MAG: hypothetical protein CMP39_04015 [Rickettsiales bacterium]|nr:hypothetical protein [Rickettsiales bacterium]